MSRRLGSVGGLRGVGGCDVRHALRSKALGCDVRHVVLVVSGWLLSTAMPGLPTGLGALDIIHSHGLSLLPLVVLGRGSAIDVVDLARLVELLGRCLHRPNAQWGVRVSDNVGRHVRT